MLLPAALVAGVLIALGLTVTVAALVPAAPDLRSALVRMSSASTSPEDVVRPAGVEARLGHLLHDRLGDHRLLRTPHRDLAVLHSGAQAWLGQKALFAFVGLAFPPVMTLAVRTVGQPLPLVLPAVASLVLASVLWFVPDVDVRTRAATARAEFARAVTAFIDLTALERAGGTGTTQALENAAQIGGSWVFERIRESLNRARWSGTTPWHQLAELSDQIGVPELADLADIMRLSGEEGVAVYDNLRSRSRSMRTAMLSREQARANADSERMVIPVALLGLLFLCLLAFPAIARVI